MTVIYLEFVLVAKKVYFRQIFCQKALDLVKKGLRNALKLLEGCEAVAFYVSKFHQQLALIYADQHFYKTGKGHLEKAQQVRAAHQALFSAEDGLKFELQRASFLKKCGFYEASLEIYNCIEGACEALADEASLKMRYFRERARILAIFERKEAASENFDRAQQLMEHQRATSVKYPKVLYLRGLASKRQLSKLALDKFEECLSSFCQIQGTEQSFFICQVRLEIAEVLKQQERLDEAQEQLGQAGLFLRDYFASKAIYGEFAGEQHPLMSQFYLLQFELATARQAPALAALMFKEYHANVLNANRVAADAPSFRLQDPERPRGAEEAPKSVFLLEAEFQRVQNLFYGEAGALSSAQLGEEVEAMELVCAENGILESQMYVNWLKLFRARLLLKEGQSAQAIELIERVIEEYVAALDGDELHVYLANFYLQLGNVLMQSKLWQKAEAVHQKALRLKERNHPCSPKQLVVPLMQLQQLTAVQVRSVDESLKLSLRALEVVEGALSQADTSLVMNSGLLSEKERRQLERDLRSYQVYKVDVLFSVHNLCKISGDYASALAHAKLHSQSTLEVYKRSHRNYAYALMLEASCYSFLPSLDQMEAVELLAEAIRIQLELTEGQDKVDSFLARLYEEKGHALSHLADEEETSSLKALQAFNTSRFILKKSGEQSRLEMVERMVEELRQNPLLCDRIENEPSPYDLEDMSPAARSIVFGADFGESEEGAEGEASTATLMAALGLVSLCVGGAVLYFRKARR